MESINNGLKKKKYTARQKTGIIFAYVLLLYPLCHLAIFYFYTNFSSIVLAFTDDGGNLTFEHILAVLKGFSDTSSKGILMSTYRSILASLFSILINMPIGVLITYALFKHIPGEMFFRVVFYIPGLVGTVVMSTIFRYLVTADGPVLTLLSKLCEIDPIILRDGLLANDKTAMPTLVVWAFWMGCIGNTVVLTGALTRIPNEIFESTRLDGITFVKEFTSIALPLIWPTLSTLLTFQLGGILLSDWGTFLLIGTGNDFGTSSMGYYLHMQLYAIAQVGSTDFHYPAATGFVFTCLSLPIALGFKKLLSKYTEEITY